MQITSKTIMTVLIKTPVPNRESFIVSAPCGTCGAAPGMRCARSIPGDWCWKRKMTGEALEKMDRARHPRPHRRTSGRVYTQLDPTYILGWDILRYLGPDVDGLWRYRGSTPKRHKVEWDSDDVMNLDND